MKFTRRLDLGSLDLANLRGSLRLAGCPHCQCLDTLVGHGFLWGLPPSGSGRETRGVRMWCTDRGGAHGCGRTTSVHWDHCIPHASLRTAQLLELLRALAAAPTRHAAWAASRLSVSLSGAYRWFARWQRGSARRFSLLCSLADPPGKTGGPPDPHHLIHLAAAFPHLGCPAAPSRTTGKSPWFPEKPAVATAPAPPGIPPRRLTTAALPPYPPAAATTEKRGNTKWQ